jgi:integrase
LHLVVVRIRCGKITARHPSDTGAEERHGGRSEAQPNWPSQKRGIMRTRTHEAGEIELRTSEAQALRETLGDLVRQAADPSRLPLAPLSATFVAEERRRAALGKITAEYARDTETKLRRTLTKLGATVLGDLALESVEAFLATRATTGARRTANEDRRVLRQLLDFAVRAGVIQRSPLADLEKMPDGPGWRVRDTRPLTRAEARALIASYQADDAHHAEDGARIPQAGVIYAALTTGARFSELARLRWSALRAKDQCLVIEARDAKARVRRRIPVSPADLRVYQQLYDLHERFLGSPPASGDLILLTPRGKALDIDSASQRLRRLCDAAELTPRDEHGRGIGWHSARKYVGTTMLERGIPAATVAQILGNSPEVLREWYHEVSNEGLRDARASMPDLQEPPAVRTESIGPQTLGEGLLRGAGYVWEGGRAGGIRTPDLLIWNQPLYRWSYCPLCSQAHRSLADRGGRGYRGPR